MQSGCKPFRRPELLHCSKCLPGLLSVPERSSCLPGGCETNGKHPRTLAKREQQSCPLQCLRTYVSLGRYRTTGTVALRGCRRFGLDQVAPPSTRLDA